MLIKNKLNNKGFTLIEILGVLVVVSTITTIVIISTTDTFSIGKEESYKIMKNNIITSSYDYIEECDENLIECDFSYENNNQFYAKKLSETGYFENLKSPIDGKDLGKCLILEAKKENGVAIVNLIDKCYQ